MKVVIADNYALVRQAVAAVLKEAGLDVVGQAGDAKEAASLCRKLQPHIILLALPAVSGLKIIPRIRAGAPNTKILILAMHEDDQYISKAMGQGAQGYVTGRQTAEELIAAIQRLRHLGISTFRPSIVKLTERERECLELIACGRTNEQIAKSLRISPKTVEAHRAHLMKKLNIRSTAGLTRYALAQGLIAL